MDEKVATRLGAADRLVDLSVPLAGPFGQAVRQMAIRHHLLPADLNSDTVAANLHEIEGGFEFNLGAGQFRYHRFGLERIKTL